MPRPTKKQITTRVGAAKIIDQISDLGHTIDELFIAELRKRMGKDRPEHLIAQSIFRIQRATEIRLEQTY